MASMQWDGSHLNDALIPKHKPPKQAPNNVKPVPKFTKEAQNRGWNSNALFDLDPGRPNNILGPNNYMTMKKAGKVGKGKTSNPKQVASRTPPANRKYGRDPKITIGRTTIKKRKGK